ncbi:MAG: tail-specific protease [Acidobacteria bacterium]|nr:MAG: tail-specific protease [Acidobacteriota bacterium]
MKTYYFIFISLLLWGFNSFGDQPSKDQLPPAADQTASLQEDYHPYLARIVAGYLSYNHYSGMRIDDFTSREMFDNYFKMLDYNKMYFTASDVEQFRPFQYALDDMLLSRKPDLRLAFDVYELFQKRVKERVHANLALLDQKFDFTLDESICTDREDAEWASSKAELDELWRKRIKEQVLGFLLRDKSYEETIELLKKRYKRNLKDVYDVKGVEILERYLTALTSVFDPHSSYMKPASKENFNIGMEHAVEGIGATLRRDQEYTAIVDLTPGGPAQLSGELQPGDKIIAVAQGEEEPVDIIDMKLQRVVSMIRGKKGTEVRLTVIPSQGLDSSETKIVSITRDKVKITANDAKYEIKEIKSSNGHSYKFGVIDIPGFYQDTNARYSGDENYKSLTKDVRKILAELKEKQVDAIAIDLRLNSGGSLPEAITLSGLFIKDGPIVQVQDRQSRKRVLEDPDPEIVYEGPLVVLTSAMSASASEIFAGAIQDYGRGIVIGSESTHGKGTVQNMVGLQRTLEQLLDHRYEKDVAGALKFTIQQFYRVNGSSTQNRGIVSDIALPSPYDRYGMREEELPRSLPWNEIDPAEYVKIADLGELINELKALSAKRVEKNKEFQYLKEDLAYWDQLEEESTLSLNMDVRKKEMMRLDELEKNRKAEREKRLGLTKPKDESPAKTQSENKPGKAGDKDIPDFILEEALNILADYCDRTGIKIVASELSGQRKEM